MEQTFDAMKAALSRSTRLDAKWLVIGGAVIVVGVLALIPLVFLFWQSFFTPQVADNPAVFTFGNYKLAYGSPETLRTLFNSLKFALGASCVSFSIGTMLAWIIERTNTPLRKFFYAITIVPLIVPSILFTIAWIFLASPKIGVLNVALGSLFGVTRPVFNIYSMSGMIWVDGLHYSTMAFLLMSAAFRGMDPSLEESSLMSGAGVARTMWRITLRLAFPAIVSTLLILFVRALESFEVPALIGLPVKLQVFTSSIYEAIEQYPSQIGLASSYSMLLLIITSVGLYLQSRVSSGGGKYSTMSGKGFRPRVVDIGKWRYLTVGVFVVYFLLIVALPFAVLLWSSLQKYYRTPSLSALHHLSFDAYRYILHLPTLRHAVINSLALSFGCATAVMLLSAVICWIVVKTKLPGRWLLDNLASLPLVFPGLVLGLSFMIVSLKVDIGIYGTLWILLTAYITRFMPYGMRYTTTSMVQIHKELEESAAMSCASWSATFFRIVLPLLKPGLLAGWIYVMIVSIRELSSSILLYSPGSETVSIVIWELWQNGQYVELSALSVMLVLALLALVMLLQWIGGKFGVKANHA
ncbi:ABC transporter substrate-binding protein (plasmid) [Burkholderia sp. SFA1]|uniref:ABC transporter permease n=1 Tax=unclassified Caballeronia TaxID=2646786 RepID=UPI001F340879|nr:MULTISPECIES: iron ABC transporter permease [unclassified Caballeronia]MCE4546255.1 iron ABC transporter permease [Caballeronia sp. PC1]MCE4573270.1 iron ABC transporter permease [Caballeronia sp. CLC5]BBQ01539.1 ABC transporter substrate-binding protein [Burkholderia sp. SFA1]